MSRSSYVSFMVLYDNYLERGMIWLQMYCDLIKRAAQLPC